MVPVRRIGNKMAYGQQKNSPKRQPCLKCGKRVKRVSQDEWEATYYCRKCDLESKYSLRVGE